MPNGPQQLFLVSTASSFLVCYFVFHALFPGFLPDVFLLFRSSPPPPKTTTTDEIMASFNKLLSGDWDNLTGTDKLTALAFVGVTLVAALFLFKPSSPKARKPVLDPKDYKEFPLVEKKEISPNTARYRFALPHPEDSVGLPIGQHITIAAEIGGKTVSRSYTPTSTNEDLGHFELVIKSYEKGNISKYMSTLKIGDRIKVKGPKGQFNYSQGLVNEFGMIAGGTGITPMYQIITHILYNRHDPTKISLIYANVNENDILLKLELDELAARNKDRFTIYYVLNNPPEGWNGGVGFVSKQMIEEKLPAHTEGVKTLLCGPPPMIKAMKGHLEELKYPPAQTISKLHDAVFVF